MKSADPAPRWHYVALALWPLLLSLLNINWAYGELHNTDAWYAFGDFHHFPRIHLLSPAYPHERVAWILPGAVLVRLLGAGRGLLALHWLMVAAGLLLAHEILRRATDARTALLGALMMGCSPAFLGPNGWSYPDGLLMVFILAAVAVLVWRPDSPQTEPAASLGFGAAVAGFTSIYPLWLCLTPAYVFLLLSVPRVRDFRWKPAPRLIALAGAGFILGALGLAGIYYAMGGRGFFLASTVAMSRYVSNVGNIPWVRADWAKAPVWLILPSLALCCAILGLVEIRRRPDVLSRVHRDLLLFYLVFLAIMVALTIHPTRVLALDFKTLVTIPAVFLVFALTVFRVPATISNAQFYGTAAVAVAVSLATLIRPGLYEIADRPEFLAPACALLIAVTAMRLWRPQSVLRWSAGVLLFATASLGIIPSYYRAWLMPHDGPEMIERVSLATRTVLDRLPATALPIFWFQNQSTHLAPEFQGVMDAFMSRPAAMLDFPRIDRPLPTGTRVFLLREGEGGVALARYMAAMAGMPLTLKSRDRIAFGGESYWITQFEVQSPGQEAIRENVEPAPVAALDFNGTATLRLPAAGAYQIELRYPGAACTPALRATGEAEELIEDSGVPLRAGGDSVVWLRLTAKAGEAVHLEETSGCRPSGAQLTVLTLGSQAAVEDDADRWWSGTGEVRAASGCRSRGCVEFRPSREAAPSLAYAGSSTFEPGKIYEFQARIRSVDGHPIRMECGVWDWAQERWVKPLDCTAGADWSPIHTFFEGAPGRLAPLFRESLGQRGPIAVEGLSIAPSKRVKAEETLIPNGAFERGLEGWSSLKGDVREGSECYRGGCVEFRPRGTEMQYVVAWDGFAPVQGKTYELSAWVRSGAGKPLRIQWGFWQQKVDRWVAPQTDTAALEWTKVTHRFVSDTNAKLSPIFWESQGDFGPLLVDEVELREVK